MTTRERILAAAAAVFAAEGYSRATMDGIAQRAGLSKGALYFHFASKEELFLALMDHMAELLWASVGEALGSVRGASARIAAALRAALEVFERHPELTRVTVVQGATAGETALARQQALRDSFEDVIARYVEELVADGDAPPQDPRLTALALFGTVWAAVTEWATRPAPRPLAVMADGIIAYNLRGIGVRAGDG
ncbi:MAG: TetR/AcrR family transcriptional regulator [Firmicutes bacterium]|nr:TetR/AcrR family transcriptional regulator [Bacillota bacterium]